MVLYGKLVGFGSVAQHLKQLLDCFRVGSSIKSWEAWTRISTGIQIRGILPSDHEPRNNYSSPTVVAAGCRLQAAGTVVHTMRLCRGMNAAACNVL